MASAGAVRCHEYDCALKTLHHLISCVQFPRYIKISELRTLCNTSASRSFAPCRIELRPIQLIFTLFNISNNGQASRDILSTRGCGGDFLLNGIQLLRKCHESNFEVMALKAPSNGKLQSFNLRSKWAFCVVTGKHARVIRCASY